MSKHFGKGLLPDPPDPRDYLHERIFGAALIDFSTPYILPEPPDSDQANADCCVGESWSYAHWQLKRYPFSVRSVFAYIAQDYGAYIRDGGLRICQFGQETLAECPDPSPKTAQNMRDRNGLNPEDGIDDTEFKIVSLPKGINGVAIGIRDYKASVFGIVGSDEGWADLAHPRPPLPGEETWGHALYPMGYHMHDGQKCIIAKSSWCNTGVKQHHIKENYFKSFNTMNAWGMIPKENLRMLVFFQVKGRPTLWALMDGQWVGFSDMNAYNLYVHGRPNVVLQIDQSEFDKIVANQDVFKS